MLIFSAASSHAGQGKILESGNLLLILFLILLGSFTIVTVLAWFLYVLLNSMSDAPRRTAWGTIICANLGFFIALIIVVVLQTDNYFIIFPAIIIGALAGGRIGHYYSSPVE